MDCVDRVRLRKGKERKRLRLEDAEEDHGDAPQKSRSQRTHFWERGKKDAPLDSSRGVEN